MLDWLFGKANKNADNAKRTAFHNRDDGKFCFRKLLIYQGALVRKKGEQFIEGWEHHYNNQFSFDGFKDISADMVTITTARDVLYDPFNIVNSNDKPDKSGKISQAYISERANSAIYDAQKQKPKGLMGDKVTIGLLIVDGLLALAFFITRVAG